MKPKVFKYLLAAFFTLNIGAVLSQETPPEPPKPAPPSKDLDIKLKEKLKDLDIKLDKLKELKLEKLDLAMSDLSLKLDNTFQNLGEDMSKNFMYLEKQFQQSAGVLSNTVEKSKTISKSYPISAKDKLSIDNQYGSVTINTWAKNEIKVDVIIKAFGASDKESEELLNGVSVNEMRQNNLISFKTSIASIKSNWWGVRRKGGTEERRGVEVNYQVYMPAKNPLDISNKYGNTVIPNFDGVLNINSSYGSFSGQNLSNPANQIHVSYGSASIVDLKAGNLAVSYGSLEIENAGRLNASVSYSSAKIGKLSETGDFNIRYSGGFKINEVGNNVKDLNINAAYSALSLGFAPSASFDFDVTVNYAGFKYDNEKVSMVSQTPDNEKGFNPSKNYKGRYGKGSGARVIIKSNYGSVRFL